MFNDPKILAIAFLGGIIPSLVWLWFWLREDKKKAEPKGLLTLLFIMGMLSVIIVLPIQSFLQANIVSPKGELIAFAGAEEIIKFLIVIFLIRKTGQADQPIDWAIYMITGALGFAALENMLFLIKPLSLGDSIVGLLTGQLRFLGSTLLHAVAGGIVGIAMGVAFYKKRFIRIIHVIFGLFIAIFLHSLFNFFIMKNNGSDFLKIFAFLWVVTIMVMLLFERLRRISN